jgi:PRC-barrel domain
VRAGFRTILPIAATLVVASLAINLLSIADTAGQVAQPPAGDQPAAPAAPAPPAPAAAPPATPPPAEAPPGSAGTPATVLDDQQVVAILGRNVRGREGEDMGRIVDVIVNRSGQVRAAIIDFGGFLGVGSRKVAVDWSALRFEPTGKPDRITVDLARNSVRLAPEYKEGTPVVVLGPSDAAQSAAGAAAKDAAAKDAAAKDAPKEK